MPVLIDKQLDFPPVERADRWGFLAVGGDLSPRRLLLAYRSGIFPWGGEPVRWYSPDPRCIIELADAEQYLSRRLLRTVRHKRFEIRINTAFEQVIRACAAPAPGREATWLTPRMIAGYIRLHELGHAHSVESWRDGRLVGGLYGIACGGYFSGESMFLRESDASKVAYVALLRRLSARGYVLLDCQVPSYHLFSLGATLISRVTYLTRLRAALKLNCAFVDSHAAE